MKDAILKVSKLSRDGAVFVVHPLSVSKDWANVIKPKFVETFYIDVLDQFCPSVSLLTIYQE